MYFITEQDPDYTVKGSRDPLGFQVIWQEAGRKLIPFLSTVSNNIKDFQILCIGYALKKDMNIQDKDFEPFFIRFEQLMAYTRFEFNKRTNNEEGFNGIDKVRKIMSVDNKTIKISNLISDQILSNQRAYGILGKYIRPFTDMGMINTSDFDLLFNRKINENELFKRQLLLLKKKSTTEISYINTERLKDFYSLIEKPKNAEKQFFTSFLLNDNCNNELLKLFREDKSITDKDSKITFYSRLDTLTAMSENSKFINILNYIKNTELVLSPLNHIFRYIQTRSFWKFEEIKEDEYISKWRTIPDTSGFNETSKSLAKLLQLTNIELIKELAQRNDEVSKRRNSASWLRITSTGIEVNHFEGGFLRVEYNPEIHNDNSYFLSTFISLYNQLN